MIINCYECYILFTVATHHINALEVICSNEGCPWVGELGSLETHLKTCEYAIISCTNECTYNSQIVCLQRRQLDDYLTNDCSRRLYECPHCQETEEHQERITTHLDTCPKVKVRCPNVCCTFVIPRDSIIPHRSICNYQRVHCKYATVGCRRKLLRKNLKKHEEDYQLHLQVTNKKVLDLMKLMKQPLFRFRVAEFQDRKTNAYEFYSRPFFTFCNGYKMCICVDAIGCDCEGTHVSVYVYLMKGDNDNFLSWPFTGTVTIELLNQLEDKNHYKEILTLPADSEGSQRVADGERGQRGYGYHKFISHADLDYNADKNTQYLKDDTLVFSIVSVEVPDYKPWLECTD